MFHNNLAKHIRRHLYSLEHCQDSEIEINTAPCIKMAIIWNMGMLCPDQQPACIAARLTP